MASCHNTGLVRIQETQWQALSHPGHYQKHLHNQSAFVTHGEWWNFSIFCADNLDSLHTTFWQLVLIKHVPVSGSESFGNPRRHQQVRAYLEGVLEGLQFCHHAVPHHTCQLRAQHTYSGCPEQTASTRAYVYMRTFQSGCGSLNLTLRIKDEGKWSPLIASPLHPDVVSCLSPSNIKACRLLFLFVVIGWQCSRRRFESRSVLIG